MWKTIFVPARQLIREPSFTMETYSFQHVEPFPSQAHIVLVQDVRNAQAILEDVKAGGERFGDMPMALIDAKMISSTSHLLVSIHQAILRNARRIDEKITGLRTKSIHSEILWNLSITNNIAETFRTFGLSDQTKDLLFIHIAKSPQEGGPKAEEVLQKVQSIGEGHIAQEGLSILDEWQRSQNAISGQDRVDWDAICKAYKLGDMTTTYNDPDDIPLHEDEIEQNRRKRIDSIITSLVAMKFVAS